VPVGAHELTNLRAYELFSLLVFNPFTFSLLPLSFSQSIQ
jgi:hypothetical protein